MRGRRLVGFALVMMFTVGACEKGDVQLVKDFVTQWATDHAGEIALHKFGLPSGNDYVDAAVDGAEVILNIEAADKLMAKGRAKSDPKAMDAALKLRPHDWSYELSRAHLALRQGDTGTYDRYFDGAQQDASGPNLGRAYMQEYRELVKVHKELYALGRYDSYYQCERLYSRLSALSQYNHLPPGFVTDPDRERWDERYARCDTLPR